MMKATTAACSPSNAGASPKRVPKVPPSFNFMIQTPTPTTKTIQSVAAEYGQTIRDGGLYNRKNVKIADLQTKGDRLRFLYTGSNRLMGSIPTGDLTAFERVLRDKFYCSKNAA
jgi:hypothetical protein